MQTINFEIERLLESIRAGHFLIPQFQRDFTWREGQTRLLVDSIARNYPIGSLLILERSEKISFKARKLDATISSSNTEDTDVYSADDPSSKSYYVLDGQQRLTSIARVFLNANPKRTYYFDLKEMYEKFDKDDPIWVVSRPKSKKIKNSRRLIRTEIALNPEKCDIRISEYIEDSGDFPEFENDRKKARTAASKLRKVFEVIRKYSIPCVVLDNNTSLESVCRVFETINSTGTKLTTFDLAVAKFFPKPDLKTLLDNSKNKFSIIEEYDVDGECILQILALYYLREIEKKFPEAKRSVLLNLNVNFIDSRWEDATFHLVEVLEWIKRLGATAKTRPPHGIIVSIAASLMCFPNNLENPEFSFLLRKWYFCTTLSTNPSPNTNYKIGDDFRQFCLLLEQGKPLKYPKVHFTTDDLINIRRIFDRKYRAIQALMRTTVKEDLLTGNQLDAPLEDHHIFPLSLNKSGLSKHKLNSIVNRIIVSQSTNRDLSNKNPDQYIFDLTQRYIKQGNTGDLDRRLENCFIPYNSNTIDLKHKLSQENFNNFLHDRASMIIRRIQDVVGGAWDPPSDSDEINVEDDSF